MASLLIDVSDIFLSTETYLNPSSQLLAAGDPYDGFIDVRPAERRHNPSHLSDFPKSKPFLISDVRANWHCCVFTELRRLLISQIQTSQR